MQEVRPYDWAVTDEYGGLLVEAARPGYRQVAADLRQQIISGKLKPGDSIPANSALAARFDVSMSLANAAVAQLEREGLVEVGHGRPTTVRRRRQYLTEVSGIRWTAGEVIDDAVLDGVAAALAAAERADPELADAGMAVSSGVLTVSVLVTAPHEGYAGLRASVLARSVLGDGWDLESARGEARPADAS